MFGYLLRPATISDLDLLLHWDKQPHVIASGSSDGWDWAKDLSYTPPWREQLIAELDGRPIGFVQIIDPLLEETHYWGTNDPNLRAIDIWIGEESDLNKGYGTTMMKLALNRCFMDTMVNAVLIDPLSSNLAAIRFYQRLGFVFLEERLFDEDRCAVHELTRTTWKQLIVRMETLCFY